MKVTRKNIGYYHIEHNGRKFEILKQECGSEWNMGEIIDNGYGFESCDSYFTTLETLRDCKYVIEMEMV